MCHADDVLPFCSVPVKFLGGSFSDSHVYNFFVLSGYFLGLHTNERKWWKTACVKRITTLLVPYVCWNILYFVVYAIGGISHESGLLGVNKIFGFTLGLAPICYPMWYVKTLYIFVMLSPVFVWCLHLFRKDIARACLLFAMIGTYIFALYFNLLKPEHKIFANSGLHPLGCCFFCIGIFLSQVDIKRWWCDIVTANRYLTLSVSLSIWILSAVFANAVACSFVKVLNIGISSLCLFSISSSIGPIPMALTRSSFFIYGTHLLFLIVLGKCFSVFPCAGIIVYISLLLSTVCLSVTLGVLMRRAVPILYAPLVGGRL